MITQKRREIDNPDQLEIERLIAEENDPKVRLHLMVMNRINLSMIANTESTREVAATVQMIGTKLDNHLTHFEEHIRAEDAVINKGKGAWMIFAKVIACVQVIGLGIWGYAANEIKGIHSALHNAETADAALDKRVTIIESKIK